MKYIFLLMFIILIVIFPQGCKSNTTEPETSGNDTSGVHLRKPNIYIYPDSELELSVNILFPNGGKVIESEPEYNNGWNVTVDTSGKINNKYDYLFYESINPNFTQKNYGWIIKKEELKEFFESNMLETGFNEKEIYDFTEYWILLLTEYKYYEVYPQYIEELENMNVLNFTPAPDNVFRLLYVIKGNETFKTLPTPEKRKAVREGFYVLEWGVVMR